MSREIRRGRSVVYKMHVHLVFVAKYRKDVFSKMDQEVVDDLIQHENQKSETDSQKYIRLEKAAEAKLAAIGVENALN